MFATHYFELTQLPEHFPSARNVHLSAVEHKEKIVFLHAVQEGPASQSYGLQVAQLAGIPNTVIKSARKHLAQLENQSLQANSQFDLFAAVPPEPSSDSEPEVVVNSEHEELLREFADIEPDELSPRAALEVLYQIKSRINQVLN